MSSIDEKRVYSDKTGKEEVLVATDAGVVAVDVSDDLVGRFGIEHRCNALDVASTREGNGEGGLIAVATDEDVLVSRGDEFEETDFGPAAAVSFHGGSLIAAAADGRVSRRTDGYWTDLGWVDAIRAVDGPMLAAADGVYRVEDESVAHVGLDDARDVASAGIPFAATGSGIYRLGNGWIDELEGEFRVVASDGVDRTHAVSGTEVYARDDGEWGRVDAPTEELIVDMDYGTHSTFAITEAGTFLVTVGDGWRQQLLGLRGVAGLAVR